MDEQRAYDILYEKLSSADRRLLEIIMNRHDFVVGDYIRTSNGVGIVKHVLGPIVVVQHKYGYEDNANNEPIEEVGSYCCECSKVEYDKEVNN